MTAANQAGANAASQPVVVPAAAAGRVDAVFIDVLPLQDARRATKVGSAHAAANDAGGAAQRAHAVAVSDPGSVER
ncbi:MAG: hypothetical protein OHK0044_25400 [Burkholderiaceae bacterium]